MRHAQEKVDAPNYTLIISLCVHICKAAGNLRAEMAGKSEGGSGLP